MKIFVGTTNDFQALIERGPTLLKRGMTRQKKINTGVEDSIFDMSYMFNISEPIRLGAREVCDVQQNALQSTKLLCWVGEHRAPQHSCVRWLPS